MKISLNYFTEKIKGLEPELYIVLLIIVIASFGFGLGQLWKLDGFKTPIVIRGETSVDNVVNLMPKTGKYVASQTGKSYYFPWCIGVKRIKESNKIWFNTKEEASAAGYNPASNCKGL